MEFRLYVVAAGVVACLAAAPETASADSSFQRQRDVVYGESHGVGLIMDVFQPAGPSNGVGLVDVVSGAWHSDRGKLRDHEKAQVFEILCGRGYTVFAVRPGSITKFTIAEMLDHLKQGIRWVKNHSVKYDIDPERLGIMGASAGGHLACLAAVTAKRTVEGDGVSSDGTAVRAAAVFFPPTDLLNYGGQVPDVRSGTGLGAIVRRLAFPDGIDGLSDKDIERRVTAISPARLVNGHAPPFLFIHGDVDFLVPLQQSRTMVAALKDAGVDAELIVKHGGGHPWPTIHEEVKVLADWFDARLEVDAAP